MQAVKSAVNDKSPHGIIHMARICQQLKNHHTNYPLLSEFISWFKSTKQFMSHYHLTQYLDFGQDVVDYWYAYDPDYVDIIADTSDPSTINFHHRQVEGAYKLCKNYTTLATFKNLISTVFDCYYVTDHSRIINWMDSPNIKRTLFKITKNHLDPLAIYGFYKFCGGDTLYSSDLLKIMSFYSLFSWISPTLYHDYFFYELNQTDTYSEELMTKAKHLGLIQSTNKDIVSNIDTLQKIIENGQDEGLLFSAILYGKTRAINMLCDKKL